MAWLLTGTCEECSYTTGQLLDRGFSIYGCPACRTIASVEYAHRRFDMPRCRDCNRRSDRIKIGNDLKTTCPRCLRSSLRWICGGHVRLQLPPEPKPRIGEIVHGSIKNTGYLQRLVIVHSFYRGRISRDQPTFPDKMPVEAKVLSIGSRSLDVQVIGETVDPLKMDPEISTGSSGRPAVQPGNSGATDGRPSLS